MLNNSTVLITGGSGSFGNNFIQMTLRKYNPKKIIVYSRDEMKQWEMMKNYKDKRLRFFIGNIRDEKRLFRALNGVDYVIHAAATNIISTAEYNPFECIKTNVDGTINLIESCIDAGVKKVIALSTDKASNPINLVGASKYCSEKLFVAGNAYSPRKTKFSVVRYGSIMGTKGSVIPYFIETSKTGKIMLTSGEITRFMSTTERSVEMIWKAFEDMEGGEIYINKSPSMSLRDIANAVDEKAEKIEIGVRPGEKMHEQLVSVEESVSTYSYDGYYKILPQICDWDDARNMVKGGMRVPKGFTYSSNNNIEKMTVEELKKWIKDNQKKIGKI